VHSGNRVPGGGDAAASVRSGSVSWGAGRATVSVVVPTRNRRELLAMALRSALCQRGVDVEVIVVDEASADGTPEFVATLADPRVRLVRHAVPRGPNAARNSGAREATGEWLAFLDDDDVWAPEKLSRQVCAAVESGCDWAYAGSVNVNSSLEVIHGIPPPLPPEVVAALPRYNAIPASASNVIVRRQLFAAEAGFNEHLRVCEEWDLWIRLAKAAPPACVSSPLIAYRMHGGTASLDPTAIVDGAREIERLHGTSVDWGRLHRWAGQLCLRRGRRGEALRHYAQAALRGWAREAGEDLASLARDAVRRRLGGRVAAPARRTDQAWESQAHAWLQAFREGEPDAAGVPR
jgi:hypothetical protein